MFLRRSALEGMSEVVTVLPQPAAAAMVDTVDRLARQAKADGDPRPIGVIRAEVQANLTLRPWDESRPAVTAELRVLAPLNALLPDPAAPHVGGQPAGIAEVEGEPITAAHLRALLTDLDAICPGGLQAPTGGSLHIDLLGAGGGLLATLTRRELETGGPPRLPRASRRRLPVSVGAAPPADRPLPADGGATSLRESPRPATAGNPAAGARPAGRIWTTSSRTTRAGRPTATTCAACAAGTTG